MGSPRADRLLAALAALLVAGAAAAAAPAGARAAACPQCPPNPVFLDCEHGPRKATWTLGSGATARFALAGWSAMVEVEATRTAPSTLVIKLGWRAADGKPAAATRTLKKGEAVTLWDRGGQDSARYGTSTAPLRCTWVE
jgi:hypothetical protein